MKNTKKTILMLYVIIAVTAFSYTGAMAETIDCKDPLSRVFARVSKSVVLITGVSLNPFSLQDRISSAMGTGFVIHKDGLILTNSHVVFGQQAISVSLDDGRTIPAQLIGADPIMDLAVIKIDLEGKPLPELKLSGDTLPEVGDEVIAVGNPMGFEKTLTKGIVSGVNRILPISPMSMMIPMIQTDAAINPGNSGGPLLNLCGKVVGINTSVLAGAENMGFALPATIISDVLPGLIKNSRIIRPWLGVRGKLVKKEELGMIFNLNLASGFLVEMVETGSPADKAGVIGGLFPIKIAGEEFLFGGDIITEINKKSLEEPDNYMDFLQGLRVGDKVNLTLFRGGTTQKISLVIEERPLLPWDLPRGECYMAMP